MQSRRRTTARDAQSVYPPRAVTVPLAGYRSTTMTQAVRCWAKLLERATLDNQAAFAAPEWHYLAANAGGRETSIDPDLNNPGDVLAQWSERGRDFEVRLDLLGKDLKAARTRAGELADRLRKLDYLHAWAMIWALQWRASLLDDSQDGEPINKEEWWTLAHRQGKLAPEG